MYLLLLLFYVAVLCLARALYSIFHLIVYIGVNLMRRSDRRKLQRE